MDKLEKHKRISYLAKSVTDQLALFDEHRVDCDHHTNNNLNGGHNCFYGGAKNDCNPYICPLKREL